MTAATPAATPPLDPPLAPLLDAVLARFAPAALLFDLDGTLVVTEHVTDACVRAVLAERGHPGAGLAMAELGGRTWQAIAETTRGRFLPEADPTELAADMAGRFETLALAQLREVPGAAAFVRAAAARVPTLVVTSSTRAFMGAALARLGLAEVLDVAACVAQEDVRVGKPHPEPYLLGAARLAVDPRRCVVFEDSRSGAVAAAAASARVVGVTCAAPEPALLRALADATLSDYRDPQLRAPS